MTWLSDHCARRRGALAQRLRPGLAAELRARLSDLPGPRPFGPALRRADRISVIAEIKFCSPSKGELRASRDVAGLAAAYEDNGASALSVLIDESQFGGSPTFLAQARQASSLPLLAKGFLVDPVEVLEARLAGADAVLLIAACLTRQELSQMHALALELGMAALVEVHSSADLEKLEGLNPPLVGVNHRDLETLELDPCRAEHLASALPPGALKVAESGLTSAEDLRRMRALGFDAVLMGTRFMSRPEPWIELRRLLEAL